MIELGTPLMLLVALPLLYLWWRLARGPREVWPVRVAALLIVVLMAASPGWRRGGEARRVVMLVDRSLSCGREALDRGTEMAGLLHRRLGPEDQLDVVGFGQGAAALSRRGRLGEMGGVELEDASDLAAGLRLAGSLLAGRAGGRIFVITDGLATGPDPMTAVPALHAEGLAVDYSPITRAETADVAIADVRVPERVHQGHPFELSFAVHAPAACEATVRVERAGSTLTRQVALGPGVRRFTLRDTAGPAGLMRYVVSASVPGDVRPENNRALAVTTSVGPPRVLLVNERGEPDNLARALEAAGMTLTVQGPELPITSSDLKPYAAVVLENVPLSALSDRADAALRNCVRQTGGGVLVTGGKRSFAEGGYYQSRLEDVLPVSMMRKESYARPQVAMAMVLDRSGSMSAPVAGGLTKMDLANRGAAEAIGVLMPHDEAAVIAVDSTAHTVVPLSTVGERTEELIGRTLRIESMGGGIFVYTGLRAAVSELLKSEAATRHVVLFADAADSEEPGAYRELVDGWAQAGGTISVIGLGTERDADAGFLKDIARRGGGEAFFTQDPGALPRVFCEDAIRVARKTFLEEPTGGLVSPEIVRLGRIGLDAFPRVLGYNLCYTKEDAAQLITTADENAAPLLAVWQSGLGRAAALTCEADGEFTGELRTWPGYKPLFSSLVKWLHRERDDLSLFGTILRSGRTATVMLEMDAEAARGCTGARAVLIPPTEAEPIELPLSWTGPRRMEADFRLDSDGVYHGVVLTNEGRRVSLPAVVLPYSPEFEPRRASDGPALLEKLAAATGGRRVMHVRELLEAPAAAGRQTLSAAPLLAGLLLALLLADIVTRKGLWGHLVPEGARAGARGAADAVASAGRAVRRRLGRAPGPAPPEEEPPLEAEPEAAPAEEAAPPKKGRSVFARAKRRARAGRTEGDDDAP